VKTYEIRWSDREGRAHVREIEATDGRAAKRELYRQLGVKRLVGVNVQTKAS
jgi:hypothetical protein